MAETCPRMRSSGTCTDEACTYNHDVLFCEPCRSVFISAAAYETHIRQKEHYEVVSGTYKIFYCPTCGVNVVGARSWKVHVSGKRHRSRSQRVNAPIDVQPEDAHVLPGTIYCDTCDLVVYSSLWPAHLTRRSHKRQEKFVAYKSAFDEASKDRHGVTMSHGGRGVDFGIVELQDAKAGVQTELKIKIASPSSQIKIADVKLASTISSSSKSRSSYVLSHCVFLGL